MCHATIIAFIRNNLTKEEVYEKRILDVGSLNVNGTVKPEVMKFEPAKYIGIDIRKGKDVDKVVDAQHLLDTFKPNS